MLELQGIKKNYAQGENEVRALKGIDLKFRKSDFVSILGPSGCGKTTMLNIIGGLDQYTEGNLIINGKSTKDFSTRDWDAYRNHSIGFVFQSYHLIPHQNVLQNVELALTLSGVSKTERRERAIKALEQVGLGDQIKKRPGEMSGGQMQRVAIARALVNNPDIILADEPTGALDTETSVQVMEILKEISKEKLVIMVTHNPDLAEQYSTRIIRMLDGVITSDSAPLTEEEIEAARKEDKAIPAQQSGKKKKERKPSMSFATAFGLSLKNLFTKKGRTTLTAFAGSIGIIGIALIFAVSNGMSNYINTVQEDTLTAYPLTLESTTVDFTELMQSFMGAGSGRDHDNDAIYKDPIIGDLVNALSEIEASQNDLAAFKAYLESEIEKEGSKFNTSVSGVQYSYALNFAAYTKNLDGTIIKSDSNALMMEMFSDFMRKISSNNANNENNMDYSSGATQSPMMSSMMSAKMWQELLPQLDRSSPVSDVLKEQYDLVSGAWPTKMNEIVLVISENNELDDLTLYAIGLLSKSEIDAIIDAASTGNALPQDDKKWEYDEIIGRTFKTILPYDCYREVNGTFVDVSSNESMLQLLYEDALELEIVGIIRPGEDTESAMITGAIGYTHLLTEYIIKESSQSAVVQAQLANPTTDMLTGLPFKSNTTAFTNKEKADAFDAYLQQLGIDEKANLYIEIQCLKAYAQQLKLQTDAILDSMKDKNAIIEQAAGVIAEQMNVDVQMVKAQLEKMELEELKKLIRPSVEEMVKKEIASRVKEQLKTQPTEVLASLLDSEFVAYTDEEEKEKAKAEYYDKLTVFSAMSYEEVLRKIGCLDLEAPAAIHLFASTFENKDLIVEAIADYNNSVDDAHKIAYTDFLGIMMSSITTIINAITYVLIAFVAISLVVSSIMIGVITLISVQERTKEIGILRAIGASKRNVSSMFNAETMIIGFASGLLGVLITYLLCIPINAIIYSLTEIAGLKAALPIEIGIILIIISVVLNLISGLIPSRSAAKKDPVVALRTE